MKLRATDEQDLKVIAACLQDAILPIGDLGHMPEERRFVFVANRFRWEQAEPAERIHSGIEIAGVTAVRRRNIDLTDREQFLSLLTLDYAEGALTLVLSDDKSIRVEVDGLDVRMADFGEAWSATARPRHPE